LQIEYWQIAILGLIAIWFAFSVFHYYFVPPLDKSQIEDIVRFIAKAKSVRLDPSLLLPTINEVDASELKLPEYAWAINNGVVSGAIANYYKDINRIWLADGCRQNWLIYELVRYVQFNYTPLALDDKGKELEAFELTRRYLKVRWTALYRMLGILCLGMQWWTSEPY